MTYSRLQNPTVEMLEQRIALMEGAEACRTMATGMAAMTGPKVGMKLRTKVNKPQSTANSDEKSKWTTMTAVPIPRETRVLTSM